MDTPDWLIESYAIAEQMYSIGKQEKETEEKCQNLWLLGLLHNIGKRFDEINSNEKSAEILKRNNYVLYNVIKKQLQPLEMFSWALYYLNKAKMEISNKGEYIGYNKKLEEIKNKYGEKSEEYQAANIIVTLCKQYDNKYNIPSYEKTDINI